MRAFIGIELPKEIKDSLFKVQGLLSGKVAKIRWVPKKNLHITLKFLGNINKSQVEEVKNRLRKIKFKPFNLELNEIGLFKKNNEVKVIKLNFKAEDKLVILQKKIDEELLEVIRDNQNFNPHLTLGRIKLMKNKKEFLKKLEKVEFTKESFEIKEFKLTESKLTKDGSKYFTLETFQA